MTGEWPGAERRNPPPSDRHYLMLAPLGEAIRRAVAGRLAGRSELDVLDVGCGVKPYLPVLAPYARSHRGLDAVRGPYVDDIGAAEALPYDDASFDVLLCTQALEHLDEPWTAVGEFHRVLRPGGLVLASTHGVFLYHPDPPGSDRDYWRWTHSGLRRLFNDQATWNDIDILPNGEALACVGYVLAQYLGEAVDGRRGGAAVMSAFNRTIARLDSRFPPRARTPRPGSLSANYLVVAARSA